MNIGRREQIILIVFIGILIFGGGYKLAEKKEVENPQIVKSFSNEEAAQEEADNNENKTSKEGKIQVHVVGAVEYPGIYELAQGSRVNDAVLKAIPKGQAALEYINLADFLVDGQQIAIPDQEDVTNGNLAGENPLAATVNSTKTSPFGTTTGTAGAVKNSSGKINLNSADETLLQTLPGIGPTLAKRIVEYRQQSGSFKRVEDVKNVSGIGEKKFEDIKGLISV